MFERFELKYWVPERVAQQVLAFAAPYIRPDLYGPHSEVSQRNTSLYLDTPGLDFFTSHIDSAPDRFKLRLRFYGDPPRGLAFFEIKRKVKAVIVKRRAGVPMDRARALLAGDYEACPTTLGAEERSNLEAFLYLKVVHRAEPIVLVACQRAAYITHLPEEDVRLTIDRRIVYQRIDSDLMCDPRAWVSIDGPREHDETAPRVMLELKFSGVAPSWMEELAQRLALHREAYSKYVSAVAYETGERYRDPDWTAVSVW